MSTTPEQTAEGALVVEPGGRSVVPQARKSPKHLARGANMRHLAYRRIARAGGWGLFIGALAGIIAAVVPTPLAPWQLISVGTSLGMALEYLGVMPSAYRRNLLTKWAMHYDDHVKRGLITEAQRQQQVDILLSKY